MSVLIASLGDSPAVVTATLDALEREERTLVTDVVTIGTNDWDVNSSAELLVAELAEHYGGRLGYVPDRIDARDLLTESDHLAYLERVAMWLKTHRAHEVYLSLSGGRKTMVALVTIAAQIYGARGLFHLVPSDPTLEERGKTHVLRRLTPSERRPILHPEPESARLVRLPLISLLPLLDDILGALRGNAAVDSRARDMLLAGGLLHGTAGGLAPTNVGQQLLTILEDIQQLPAPRTEARPDAVIVRDHGYGGKLALVKQHATRLYERCPYATRVETIPYGNRPRTGIRDVHGDGRIDVDVSTGAFAAGLRVHTTAQSPGQTERVARELEKLLR